VAFVVTSQALVCGQPGQRPFHHPAAGDDAEPLLIPGLAHDLHSDAQRVVGQVHQPSREALVGEDVPDRGGQAMAARNLKRMPKIHAILRMSEIEGSRGQNSPLCWRFYDLTRIWL
jgi:hypothetical protein